MVEIQKSGDIKIMEISVVKFKAIAEDEKVEKVGDPLTLKLHIVRK